MNHQEKQYCPNLCFSPSDEIFLFIQPKQIVEQPLALIQQVTQVLGG